MVTVTLPQLSLAMEEGKVARWLVANGERVMAGQPIVEIETDKAVTEVESPAAGLIRLIVEAGASVAVETTLAEIEAPGADKPIAASTERRHRASPAARRVAREHGIELSQIQGSGPEGRITVVDLKALSPAARPSLRDAVLAQLSASWRDIPHIHIAGQLDGESLASAKQSAAAGTTITDLLILAVVRALRAVPELNGTLGKLSERVHLALAVATPDGVGSPVIRNASDLSLAQIAAERSRIVSAARAGASDRRDLAGGTFTLTNLGAFPVDFFAPIVSGPQIAMLATGRLAEVPVVAGGRVTTGYRMWANVAIDHRGADGLSGAKFLAALQQSINVLPHEIAAKR